MTAFMLAVLVGVLFACGAYLILQRGQIKLILGLGLISHAVNLALFGTGRLTRGAPPVVPHEQEVANALNTTLYADPLPQALILTAIVISFGVTAFIVVLVYRRDVLTGSDLAPGELASIVSTVDPFVGPDMRLTLPEAADDYDILQYELDEVYDRPESEVAHE
ncbi:MAG: Na+/H+ antiporter subunit C [Caldilineaceae bacterium]|nr:Na+/H+ antiporter subunit C [Caldilineaceae bacterium]